MLNYNDVNLNEFKNDFTICNDAIINSLKVINDEFINIEKVLQTPKSTREIPKIIMFIKNEIAERENQKNAYIGDFDYIMSTYNESIEKINSMIGDKNVK